MHTAITLRPSALAARGTRRCECGAINVAGTYPDLDVINPGRRHGYDRWRDECRTVPAITNGGTDRYTICRQANDSAYHGRRGAAERAGVGLFDVQPLATAG